jgi:DNA invertase Pin-like site-specific DNA recombinase
LVQNGILESNIIIEVGSAANEIKNRPGFQNLIQNVLKEGDTLVVTKIDRCARKTLEFLKSQDILFKRKIQFISLDPLSNYLVTYYRTLTYKAREFF